MDVNKLDQIAPALGSKDKRKRQNPDELEQPEPLGQHAPHPQHKGGEHEVEDRISVMGIPAHEMTPAVERAISILLEEIHHLRNELTHSKGHEAYLERHAEDHPFLPVMNRRALMGRLIQMLARTRDGKMTSAFVYLHIANAEHVRTHVGHDAEEGLLRLVAEFLHREFRSEALVGSMNNADFGVVLPVVNEAEARERINTVLAALHEERFASGDVEVAPEVVVGISIFDGTDQAEDIVARADADMVRQAGETVRGAG